MLQGKKHFIENLKELKLPFYITEWTIYYIFQILNNMPKTINAR